LAGVDPSLLAAIATIVFGAAVLAQGWACNISYRRYASATSIVEETTDANSPSSADLLGGLAGIVLGILALLLGESGLLTLLSAALIVFGATLILSTAAIAQVGWHSQAVAQAGKPVGASVTLPAVRSGHLLVGLAAVTLGILAVIGLASETLILAGLISLGAALLLSLFRL
jgi:hypothetical protein